MASSNQLVKLSEINMDKRTNEHEKKKKKNTMETENNSKLAFLDTGVTKEPDGHLNTCIYS